MAEEKKMLNLTKRDKSQSAAKLRRDNKVPGVIYGGRLDKSYPIYIDESELNDILKKNTKASIISASLEGDPGSVIVKEVVRNNLTQRIEHIDLQAIKRDEVLTMEIPLTFLGEEQVTYKGLLPNINLNTLQVKGPADKVPESLEVEIGDLDLDAKLLAKELKLPEAVELVTDPEELVVSISQSKMAQDLETIEEEAEAQQAADEVPEVKEEKAEAEKEEA